MKFKPPVSAGAGWERKGRWGRGGEEEERELERRDE